MTTPANTLNPGQKAGIVLTDNPTVGISAADFSATSADESIAIVADGGGATVAVQYVSEGDVDITVHRLSDGASTTLDVTHTIHCVDPSAPSDPQPFDWQLGGAVAS